MGEVKLGKYKHYKGNLYEVIGIGVHSESLEEFVVYKPLYKTELRFEGKLWVRPKEMFIEEIKVNEKRVKRFEFLG